MKLSISAKLRLLRVLRRGRSVNFLVAEQNKLRQDSVLNKWHQPQIFQSGSHDIGVFHQTLRESAKTTRVWCDFPKEIYPLKPYPVRLSDLPAKIWQHHLSFQLIDLIIQHLNRWLLIHRIKDDVTTYSTGRYIRASRIPHPSPENNP